jgi:hypothetical protein
VSAVCISSSPLTGDQAIRSPTKEIIEMKLRPVSHISALMTPFQLPYFALINGA